MPPLILAWFPFLQAIYRRSAEASIPDVTSLTQFLVYCSPLAPCCLCDFIRDLYPNLPVIFLLFVKSFVFLKFLVKDKGRLKICRSVRPLIVPIDNTEEGRVFSRYRTRGSQSFIARYVKSGRIFLEIINSVSAILWEIKAVLCARTIFSRTVSKACFQIVLRRP